jgi:hypothetical protein
MANKWNDVRKRSIHADDSFEGLFDEVKAENAIR